MTDYLGSKKNDKMIMKYLGIPLEKPKVAFFGFTGC
ncbi:unnamed protein product, partial [marine sediment metagenome]